MPQPTKPERRWPGLLVITLAALASVATSQAPGKGPLPASVDGGNGMVTRHASATAAIEYPDSAPYALISGEISFDAESLSALRQNESEGELTAVLNLNTPAGTDPIELRAQLEVLDAPTHKVVDVIHVTVVHGTPTPVGTLHLPLSLASGCESLPCTRPFELRLFDRNGTPGTVSGNASLVASVQVPPEAASASLTLNLTP